MLNWIFTSIRLKILCICKSCAIERILIKFGMLTKLTLLDIILVELCPVWLLLYAND